MIITVDCRMFNSSGIGAYIRGCLPFLLQSENNFLLIGSAEQLRQFSEFKNVCITECCIKPFSLKELFFFPLKILKQINKSDLFFTPFFNIPSNIKIPVFTTIHDIIFADMPQITSKIGLKIRMIFYRRAYKKSKKNFTVSYFSKSRIEYHLGIGKPVIVTYSAIQQKFLDYKAASINKIKKDTIIFIGNIKKHKGLDCLLDALFLAKKDGLPHRLIIIGSMDNFRSSDNAIINKIESIGGDSISFSGFVSDEKLMDYISESSLLVQPSLYEGFCLPPLEAMVLGTKALISDIPVLKEVYSEYPVTFFTAGDALDLKNKLMEILYKKDAPSLSLPEHLIYKYTFQKAASILLNNFS